MRSVRHLVSVSLLGLTFTLGACGSMSTASNTVALTASLSGQNEVPANASTASGTVKASLDTSNNTLTWTVTYTGLSGPAKAGHFHGPAVAGQNAGVAQGFAGSVESPIQGSATLTAAQASDLLAGKWYVNLHTAANPGGEIRGQVSVAPR